MIIQYNYSSSQKSNQVQHGWNIREVQDFFKEESHDEHTLVPYGANGNCSPNFQNWHLENEWGLPNGL